MTKISAVIIALNEEKNIGECLDSVAFCDEKIVVDSGSRDQTVAIAEARGAKVIKNPFVDFASQKNFGIEQATGDWVLLIDADERVGESLVSEIKKTIEAPKFNGYYFKRVNRIFGRWMRHGDNAGDQQLRLVRKKRAHFEGVVHERIVLTEKTGILKNPLLHYSTENISSYMQKLNHYTSLETTKNGDTQLILHVPIFGKPFALFLYRAFWQRGILDGIEGVFFSILSAYYEFLRQAKRWELQTEAKS